MKILNTKRLVIEIRTAVKDGYWHYTTKGRTTIVRLGILTQRIEAVSTFSVCVGKYLLLIGFPNNGYVFDPKSEAPND